MNVEDIAVARADLVAASERLASLAGYVPVMLETYEGRLYLRLLTETATHAVEWVQTRTAAPVFCGELP